MTTPTFQEQYNKIVGAYYKNELKPMSGCACFVGNLLNNNSKWEGIRSSTFWDLHEKSKLSYIIGADYIRHESNGLYSPEDIVRLERNFLMVDNKPAHELYKTVNEDDIYISMVSTLEMLREIHESKGEIVQDYTFTKRLQPCV